MKSVTIIGFGWLGKACAAYLHERSYEIKVTKRNIDNSDLPYPVFAWELGNEFPPEAASNIVIISIAESENNYENYHKLYRDLEKLGVKKVIFISSTSIYTTAVGEVDETFDISTVNTSVALKEKTLQSTSLNTIILRLSGLVGPGRNPARFLAGKTNVANPTNKINLVHQFDVIRIIEQCILQNIIGIFNVCSSSHPTRREFYTDVCLHDNLTPPTFATDTEPVRWVSNEKTKQVFGFEYQYDDLYAYYLRSEDNA